MRAASTAIGVALVALSRAAAAQPAPSPDSCEPHGLRDVLVTASVAAGAGIGAALATSGILAKADHTRDFHFPVGFGAGGGVALGLSAIYGVFDYYTGCHMVNASGGFAWSVPIVTVVVGALLPVAVWGASPKLDDAGAAAQPLSAPMFGYRGSF